MSTGADRFRSATPTVTRLSPLWHSASNPVSTVTGYRETARSLRKLARRPKAIVGPAIRKALKPMLAKTRANLKANNSYHRGVLSRSMAIRRLKTTTALSVWTLAATGRGVGIAHLVEGGTRPHWQPNFRGGWMHPGAKAKPFLEPAYFAHDDDAVRIFGQEIGAQMISYASSIAARSK